MGVETRDTFQRARQAETERGTLTKEGKDSRLFLWDVAGLSGGPYYSASWAVADKALAHEVHVTCNLFRFVFTFLNGPVANQKYTAFTCCKTTEAPDWGWNVNQAREGSEVLGAMRGRLKEVLRRASRQRGRSS